MGVLNAIASSNFIVMNKVLMKKIGINETLLLGEFASEYDYWKARGELSDGFFFSTIENIEQATTLNEYAQRKAINNLKKMGIVEVKLKGLPCKRYVKINEEVVLEILDINTIKNQGSSSLKFKELDTENLKGNKNISNKNIINNNNNNKDIVVFEEVAEKKDSQAIINIVDYLNMKTNSNYRANNKKTQTLINSRFKDGFTENDFKVVIDKKCMDWLNDSKMSKYLRPETLFGNKFEGYLNEPTKQITTNDIAKKVDWSDF